MALSKTKSSNIKFLGVILAISGSLTAILAAAIIHNNQRQNSIVMINQQEIKVEIASTPEEQYQGLSGRKSICADCGLLFNFSDFGPKTFVMRNMKFPLDIIFINDGVIKNIAANLVPEGSAPKNFYESDGPADQVLEVNGGYCEKYNIKSGDRIWIR
ncbi:MAG: DUF192 domain-containing protein [Patescibacteria group bacterium]|jgi:hypothetical protein